MSQKERPESIANFNPEAKVASPPIDYSKTRTITDKPWALACIVMAIAFFAIGGSLAGAAKTSFKLKKFGSGTPSDYMKALGGAGDQLADEYAACMKANFDVTVTSSRRSRQLLQLGTLSAADVNRRLSTEDKMALELHRTLSATVKKTVDSDNTMFDMFAQNMDITMGLICIAAGVAVLWILCLQFAATPVVWITLGVKIAFLIYVGSLANGAPGVQAFFYIVAALSIVWCFRNTDKIRSAAQVMSIAAKGLSRNPSLVLTCLAIYVPYLLVVYAYISFVSKVPLVWEWVSCKTNNVCPTQFVSGAIVEVDHCVLQVQPWAYTAQDFLTFGFYFFTGLVIQTRLFTTVGVISTWYYQIKEGKPTLLAPYWLVIGLTKSLGSLTIGATIAAICDYIDKKSRTWCWCFDPVAWVSKFFMICFKAFIQSLTRMNTAIHAFTGESFCKCTTITRAIMKRNFVGGIATEFISNMVMSLATFVFSVGMTFTAWYWFEQEYDGNFGLLTKLSETDNMGEFYLWAFLILFCVWNTYITVMVFSVAVAPIAKGCIKDCSQGGLPVIIPLAAIFIGCVSHIVFEYVLGLVKDATTAMLMSIAVDRDNNTVSNEDAEIVAVVQAVPCLYAPEGAVVAQGTELKRRSSKHVV